MTLGSHEKISGLTDYDEEESIELNELDGSDEMEKVPTQGDVPLQDT